ncbi:homoserine dehydrogenase [Neobacillus mesonae]|uniref:homoserine dehydrogenase n=1 Tax=Neobacillus mesonae TaxID=1193713 RepID=UPI00203DF660|nr:homoserine dehydrogenase [Neobacillus mesonae]MCM3569443.1 homoserine dehydrogenase [Neobacillus mesonae]
MSVIKVAILGFGTVGEGVYRTIQSHAEEFIAVLGKKVEVAAILIKNKQKERGIHDNILLTSDFEEILKLPQLDVVIEAITGKEAPFIYLKEAVTRGCHIITANKEMFAYHGKELLDLARAKNVSVGYEATVAGGIPVIQTLRQLLKINRVSQIQGILNGTSNFILSEMREKNQSFAESLHKAQEKGYAEADPTNDVEGFDAFYKAMILSRIAFGEEPNWEAVERQGITSITRELMEAAEKIGLRFKHVASISRDGDQVNASVKPVLVDSENPFYHVEGVENAVNVHSDIVGRITLQGPGAGMFPTASAMIEDLVYVCQGKAGRRRANHSSACIESDKKEQKELWLVQELDGEVTIPAIKMIDEVSKGIYLVESAKEDMLQFASQHPTVCYFSILGKVDLTVLNNEKAIVTVL